ncbi:MAG: tRNA (adenosine(37)-N6)-threonylcarbamoyltransferase complex dimerization subunit type 1 TsaB [Tenericutes bacterium]|nr:tRNA (adenosine(37)-N6)-threonylcarbamoyltransferase complex dimerization subunit type 1 TsaB [Mycoplasmatota bacterium]
MRKLSKILVIDTATKYIFLSLVIDGVEKSYIYQQGINNHSVTIIPLLDEMLQKEKLTLRDLNEIIIGIGPGSYTGVRIGVTVAKMIGYLNKIRVRTISSLALIASASSEKMVVPFVDARRGNAFMSVFNNKEKSLERIEEDCLKNIEDYRQKHNFVFISEGKPDVIKILNSDLFEEVDNIHNLKPNYLRITEAERNKG